MEYLLNNTALIIINFGRLYFKFHKLDDVVASRYFIGETLFSLYPETENVFNDDIGYTGYWFGTGHVQDSNGGLEF